MPYPNIFDPAATQPLLLRLADLQPTDKARWGKMNASQMVAHLNATFQSATAENAKRPPFLLRILLQGFFKKKLIGDQPIKPNMQTAAELVIKGQPDFAAEITRFHEYMQQIQADGGAHFAAKRHPAFGHLTKENWSNMLYKHIDHHLQQFGR